MAERLINPAAIKRRARWISEIVAIKGAFGDTCRIEAEIADEVAEEAGSAAIMNHLRLCGAIPEGYQHDSGVEKLYSKYTDALLAITFRHFGMTSLVLTERADAADVEAVARDFSLVAAQTRKRSV